MEITMLQQQTQQKQLKENIPQSKLISFSVKNEEKKASTSF